MALGVRKDDSGDFNGCGDNWTGGVAGGGGYAIKSVMCKRQGGAYDSLVWG